MKDIASMIKDILDIPCVPKENKEEPKTQYLAESLVLNEEQTMELELGDMKFAKSKDCSVSGSNALGEAMSTLAVGQTGAGKSNILHCKIILIGTTFTEKIWEGLIDEDTKIDTIGFDDKRWVRKDEEKIHLIDTIGFDDERWVRKDEEKIRFIDTIGFDDERWVRKDEEKIQQILQLWNNCQTSFKSSKSSLTTLTSERNLDFESQIVINYNCDGKFNGYNITCCPVWPFVAYDRYILCATLSFVIYDFNLSTKKVTLRKDYSYIVNTRDEERKEKEEMRWIPDVEDDAGENEQQKKVIVTKEIQSSVKASSTLLNNKGSNPEKSNVASILTVILVHLATLVTGIGKMAVWASIFSVLSGAAICAPMSGEFALTEFLLSEITTSQEVPLPTLSYVVDRDAATINKTSITDSIEGCKLILHIEIKHLEGTQSEEIGNTVFTVEHPNIIECSVQKFSMISNKRNIWKKREFCFADCQNGVETPLILSATTNLTDTRNIRIVPEIKNDACKTIAKPTWPLPATMGVVFLGIFLAAFGVCLLSFFLKQNRKLATKSVLSHEDGNTEKKKMIEISN